MTTFACSMSTSIRIVTMIVVVALMSGAIAMTAVAVVIAPGPASPVMLLAAVGMVATLVATWVFAPLRYELSPEAITVRRPVGSLRIDRANIASVEQIPAGSLGFALRLFASGGLFGVFGLFWSSAMGRFWIWGTRADHLVLLRLRTGLPVVLTPDDDAALTRELVAPIHQVST